MSYLTMFSSFYMFIMFMASFASLMVLEFLITVLTSKFKDKSKKSSDDGTVKYVIFAFVSSISISYLLVSEAVPEIIRNIRFSNTFEYIGIIMIWLGIIVRAISVITLNKAFTTTVQTTDKQKLVQKGLYKFIRNPAYTGTIISLLGIAFAYKNIIASLIVLIICLICYGKRINVEEKALRNQFGVEFEEYKKHTWRLFPLLY